MTDEERVDEALRCLLERQAQGESVSLEAVASGDPEIASRLRERLHVVRMLDLLRRPDPSNPRGMGDAPSVLEALSRSGVAVAPVSLLDAPSEPPAPVAIPPSCPERFGRYAVAGEIGRGGVGVVLKAHDADLGRDVAVKVLRAEHVGRPDVLQRFIEEAQVGGQLQHPGIVPVHDLGLRPDGRPYFVMKLVKGRTLAAMLLERAEPPQDRPRFLAVFHAVCQTVAYAHARGIVHRDLKPSNVMVGAFGEVQVVDWGMAKVLARGGASDEARLRAPSPESIVTTVRSASGSAPSIAGSVLGTPRYMPPEQALGDVDRLDERADVFALGAILCEILTGEPPYTGGDMETLQAAAEGRLASAHLRLSTCGADSQLIDVAVRCLSAAASARPRDAGVVAREIGAYFASVEESVRKAQLAAAESRATAAQERRARRLTLGLALSVLAVVVFGGGGAVWLGAQRRSRAETVSRQVSEALRDAVRLRGRAEEADPEEALATWESVLASIRQAEILAESSGADDASRETVRTTAAQFADAERRAQDLAREHRRDREILTRLDDIRDRALDMWDWRTVSADYAGAFEEYLGGDPVSLGPAKVAARLEASRVREHVIVALHQWCEVRRFASEPIGPLTDLLHDVDSDVWRARLRGATNLAGLAALAAATVIDEVPVESLLLLVERLGEGGDAVRASELALEVWRRHPNDPWACFMCSDWLLRRTPPHNQDAERFLTAAVALRPQSYPLHERLGVLLLGRGDLDGASAHVREALRLNPQSARAHTNLGEVLRERGELDAAIAEFREALRLHPEFPNAHGGLARALRGKGDLESAVAACRERTRFAPTDPTAHWELGSFLAEKGDLEGAITEFGEALRLDPANEFARSDWAKLLVDKGDIDGAITMCREALGVHPEFAWVSLRLGRALTIKGDLDGAERVLRGAIRLNPNVVDAHLNLGEALLAKRNLYEAIQEYREEIRLSPRSPYAHNSLGYALLQTGDLDGAIAAFRMAIEAKPRWANPHFFLGEVLGETGDLEGGIVELREAIRLDPRVAVTHVDLAQYLERAGRFQEALLVVRTALDLGLRPTDLFRAFERDLRGIAAAAERVPSLALGEAAPSSVNPEAGDEAYAARDLGWYGAAAKAFAHLFSLDPSALDRSMRHREFAACAAARAAAGEGHDGGSLDEVTRAHWRRQAIDWLRAVTVSYIRDAAHDPSRCTDGDRYYFAFWKRRPDLALLRDEAEIAKWPAEDQEACRSLWKAVDQILDVDWPARK